MNRFLIAAFMATTMAAGAAQAQSLTLDDFSTGAGALTIKTGARTTYQNGAGILGGARATTLSIGGSSANLFGEAAQLQIRKWNNSVAASALVFGEGFDTEARLDMGYGSSVTGKPLGLDASAYTGFRVHFVGINGVLNFNILAYSGAAYSQWGCNFAASDYEVVADFPFANAAVGGANPAQLDSFDFIFQSTGVGVDYAVSKIEFVGPDAPPASIVCPKIGGAP